MEGIFSVFKFIFKKNRNVLDSVDIREMIKAAAVDDAHLIGEWYQVLFYFFSRTTVGPLLSGHPGDFENWPLNRGWPFNRGTT